MTDQVYIKFFESIKHNMIKSLAMLMFSELESTQSKYK